MGLERNLLGMGWRDPLEKDTSLGKINVGLHPSGPSSKALLEGHQTVHVFVIHISIFNQVPSAPKLSKYWCCICWNQVNKDLWVFLLFFFSLYLKCTYGWSSPLWVHQCHVLNISMSMPIQELPVWMESSLRTTLPFSLTKSTRNRLRK